MAARRSSTREPSRRRRPGPGAPAEPEGDRPRGRDRAVSGPLLFEKLETGAEPFDIGRIRCPDHRPIPLVRGHLRRADDRPSRATRTGPTSTRRNTTGCSTRRRGCRRSSVTGLRRAGRPALAGCRAGVPLPTSTPSRSSPPEPAASSSTQSSTSPRSASSDEARSRPRCSRRWCSSRRRARTGSRKAARSACVQGGVPPIDPATSRVLLTSGVRVLLNTCSPEAAASRSSMSPILPRPPRRLEGRQDVHVHVPKDARFSTGAPVWRATSCTPSSACSLPRCGRRALQFPFDIVGAQAMLDGKATRLSGVAVAGGALLRLKKHRRRSWCAWARSASCRPLPVDPEGAKAPLPSPAPYYVAEFVLGERVVLERNRFYRGARPHHVDRFMVDLTRRGRRRRVEARRARPVGPAPTSRFGWPTRRRYGVNKSRFFFMPGDVLSDVRAQHGPPAVQEQRECGRPSTSQSTAGRCREFGPYRGTPTDQYLPPVLAGFRDEQIYPLKARP